MDLKNFGVLHEITADGRRARSVDRIRFSNLLERRISELRSEGLVKPQTMILLGGNDITFFVDLFALWRLGCCVLPLPRATPLSESEATAHFVGAKFMVIDNLLKDVDRRNSTRVAAGDLQANGERPALLLSTSGSVASPKIVAHSLENITRKIAVLAAVFRPGELDRTLSFLPTSFGHGLICNSLLPLMTGNELSLVQTEALESFGNLDASLEQNQITFFSTVPASWSMMLASPKRYELSSLRRIHCASAPFSSGLWRKAVAWAGAEIIWNVYGLTEFAGWISGSQGPFTEGSDGVIGRGWKSAIELRHADGQAPASGELGDIWVQSSQLMLGYFQNGQLDSKAESGWFSTGDLGLYQPDGQIAIAGRRATTINKAGRKIIPEELESIIASHPDVTDVCVLPVPHHVAGETVAAAIVVRSGSLGAHADWERDILYSMRDWCGERIVSYKVPSRWFAVNKIARNERGKIDRAEMIKMVSRLMENR